MLTDAEIPAIGKQVLRCCAALYPEASCYVKQEDVHGAMPLSGAVDLCALHDAEVAPFSVKDLEQFTVLFV